VSMVKKKMTHTPALVNLVQSKQLDRFNFSTRRNLDHVVYYILLIWQCISFWVLCLVLSL